MDIARSRAKVASTSRIPSSWERVDSQNPDSQPSPSPTTSSFSKRKGPRIGKTARFPLPPRTCFPKPIMVPKPIPVQKPIPLPTSIPVLSPIDYMPKFIILFIEKVVDVVGGGHCGFWAIAEFMGLTEESNIMIRRHLIQELKGQRDDYVGLYAGEYRYNYILNGLHPPTNSGGIAHVDKWLMFPDMGHIVANYYNRCVVLLTNPEIGTSESFLKIRGRSPAKQKTPIMCLDLIPYHFVLLFLKDGCPLPPSSTEWKNYKNEEAMTWEDEYLDQHLLFRDLMIIEKGEKPPQPKKESNEAEPILCDTPEKAKQQFEVIAEDEEYFISLDLPQSLSD